MGKPAHKYIFLPILMILVLSSVAFTQEEAVTEPSAAAASDVTVDLKQELFDKKDKDALFKKEVKYDSDKAAAAREEFEALARPEEKKDVEASINVKQTVWQSHTEASVYKDAGTTVLGASAEGEAGYSATICHYFIFRSNKNVPHF